jgi:hypothetical protein
MIKILEKGLAAGRFALGRTELWTKKNGPMLMIIGGCIGMVATVVLASKATYDLDRTLWDGDEEIDRVEEDSDLSIGKRLVKGAIYTEENKQRDVLLAHTKKWLNVGKLYALPATVGVVSLVSILGGYKMLNGQLVAVSAAYTLLDSSFKKYRRRVQKEVGDDRENMIRLNATEVSEPAVIGKDGEVETPEKWKMHFDDNGLSDYSRIFDKINSPVHFRTTPWANLAFVEGIQREANWTLQSRGHIFLNDVYRMLGFEETEAGWSVGWYYNGKHDDYVDFGLKDTVNQAFCAGQESCAVLDFNVDGPILSLLKFKI